MQPATELLAYYISTLLQPATRGGSKKIGVRTWYLLVAVCETVKTLERNKIFMTLIAIKKWGEMNINVTVFTSLTVSSFSAEISTVICDNQTKAETLLQTREKDQTPVLRTIVVMDSFSAELVERGKQCGVDVVTLEDVEVFEVLTLLFFFLYLQVTKQRGVVLILKTCFILSPSGFGEK